tara:strand:- start:21792 stop:22793 length:1002 start_codon:yes stop_codon:yes gene_type:complete
VSKSNLLIPGTLDAITDVRGIRVGHWTSRRQATGCTVILCESCTAGAVAIQGGAPATHETDALAGENLVRRCHAVVLTGGSAFGLASTTGVAHWLAAQGVGIETKGGPVPIVVGAGLFDLNTGPHAFPGAEEGERAAKRATSGKIPQGSVGAGTGATVAKLLGMEQRLKGGVGTASLVGPQGIVVGALAVTNAVGNIMNPEDGSMVAGPRGGEPGEMRTPEQAVVEQNESAASLRENTTLVCIATNAAIEHVGVQRLAVNGHDGLARSIVPSHTLGDGDTVFALTTGALSMESDDLTTLGLMAMLTVERAVVRSVNLAEGLAGVPSAKEWGSD